MFWQAVRDTDPQAPDESKMPGVAEGQLLALLKGIGLREVRGDALEVAVQHPSFDAWWQPFTLGVGPAGSYVTSLKDASRDRLEATLRNRLPEGRFTTTALAWTAWGHPSLTL